MARGVDIKTIQFCRDQAKMHDPDRFRVTLFEPQGIKENIWPLIAFNIEISKTREVVTDTRTGHIRLQWWRDNLARIYNKEKGPWQDNLVLKALSALVNEYKLPLEEFESLIYAREFDLEDLPPSDFEGLKHYAKYTTSPLHRMICLVEGHHVCNDHIDSVSVCYALTGLIRSIPFHARQNRIMIPDKMLQSFQIRNNQFLKGEFGPEYQSLIRDLVKKIQLQAKIPKTESKFLNFIHITTLSYLDLLKKYKYDPFSARLMSPPAILPFKLLFATVIK